MTTSSPVQKQNSGCYKFNTRHGCLHYMMLLQHVLWTADVLKYLMWKTFPDDGNSHLNVEKITVTFEF